MHRLQILFLVVGAAVYAAAPLVLSESGRSEYTIVPTASPSAIDSFALKELCNFLKETTGAEFPVVAEDNVPAAKRIFLGMGAAAQKCLKSDSDLWGRLADEESVIQCEGDDLFLYGTGRYGNLWAVYEFLEYRLGCEFLDVHGFAHIPKHDRLEVTTALHTAKYAFKVRSLMTYIYPDKEEASLFLYRNRQNFDLALGMPGVENIYEQFIPPHSIEMFVPAYSYDKRLFKYIHPPEWVRDKSYFETNPEFFSMDGNGKRIPDLHRCFSNPQLKAEFTKNIMRYYDENKDDPKFGGRPLLVNIGINDKAYNLCHCTECQELQKKYASPGAPLILFAIELAEKFPNVLFKISAYQRALTQIPIKFDGKLPPNIIVEFAPINANFSHPWNGTTINYYTLDDLRKWCAQTSRILCWYYPNTYIRDGKFMPSPSVNLDRLAADIRTLHSLGAEGTFFEQDSGGVTEFTNFSALQNYLMLKLFQRPDSDVDTIARHFISLYYGKAAPFVEKYYDALKEEHRKFIDGGGRWAHWMSQYYLTLENMRQWSKLLDDALAAETGDFAFHVRQLRLGLDSAMMEQMKLGYDAALFAELKGRMLSTLDEMASRHAFRKRRGGKLLPEACAEWIQSIEDAQKEQPLPEKLRALPEGKVTAVDFDLRKYPNSLRISDMLARRGTALKVAYEAKSVALAVLEKSGGKVLAQSHVKLDDIAEDSYTLFSIPETTLTPESVLRIHGAVEIPVGGLTNFDDPESLKRPFAVHVELRQDKRFRNVLLSRVFLTSK
ncbi:MAG: DUF4838 domain-containing protein [Victivallales bacterium]|nr:DUF4838 domain-containing protein [Victivallales bacterium]